MCSCVFGITPYVTDNTGNTPLFLRPQLVLHRECSQCSVVSSGLARTLQNTWQPGNHDNHGVSTLRKKIRIWQVRNKIPYNIYTHAHAHAQAHAHAHTQSVHNRETLVGQGITKIGTSVNAARQGNHSFCHFGARAPCFGSPGVGLMKERRPEDTIRPYKRICAAS